MAATRSGSDLVTGLITDTAPDLAERVRKVNADPKMSTSIGLSWRERMLALPFLAAEQIAQRTARFGKVFLVAAVDGLIEIGA